jgi:sugar lactone lactonase YvrE
MAFGYSIYFVERGADRVVRWSPDSGQAEVVAGGPHPKDRDQELNSPYGLAFDSGGSLLVTDKFNHRICRLRQGRLTPVPWRDATGHRARRPDSPPRFSPDVLFCPTSVLVEKGGALLAGFYDDNTIYRIQPDGRLELVLGKLANRRFFVDGPLESVPAAAAADYPVRGPVGLAERADGTIFYIERRIQVVREYHPSRGIRSVFPMAQFQPWRAKTSVPERGRIEDYHPSYPASLALDATEALYLCEPVHRGILRLDPGKGTFERKVERPEVPGAPPGTGATAIAFGPDGTAWVADSATQTVEGYSIGASGSWSPNGVVLREIGKERLRLLHGGMGMAAGF